MAAFRSQTGPQQLHILGQASLPYAHKRRSEPQLLHASSITSSSHLLAASMNLLPTGHHGG
jgi:hypothetical protein